MNSLSRLARAGLVLLLLSSSLLAQAAAAGNVAPVSSGLLSRPNILLVLVDDLGYHDLGFMGNAEVSTPRIDAFFSSSAAFMRSYVDATCSPTRSGFMTGRPPASLGFTPNAFGISQSITTIPEYLKAAGYTTLHIGKWHLGYGSQDVWPLAQGYDYFYGFLFHGFLAGPDQSGNWVPQRPTYLNPWLMENNDPAQRREGHLTALLTDKVLERLDILARQPSPWMMNVWHYAPHAPQQPDPAFVKERSPAGIYKAVLAQLDHEFGRILDHLDKTGLAANTVVIFASDNGGTNAAIANNRPFPGTKAGFLEGGVRTPLAIRWPGMAAPRRIEEPVSNLDVARTLLGAANAAGSAELPGRDLRPALRGKGLASGIPLYWEARSGGAYLYGVMSADGRWRYGEDLWEKAGLYDMRADPTAQRNLVGDASAQPVLKQLRQDYREWHDRQRQLFYGAASAPLAIAERGIQRTPGFNEVTWAARIDPPHAPGSAVIFSQSGVGSISVAGRQVTAQLYGATLRGELGEHGCQVVALATRATHPGPLSKTHELAFDLYVADRRVDSVRLDGRVAQTQYREPLIVAPTKAGALHYLVWGEYVEAEDQLAQPGVQRLTRKLCQTPAPAHSRSGAGPSAAQ